MATLAFDAQSAEILHQGITKALKYGDMLRNFPSMIERLIQHQAWKYRTCRAKGRPFSSIVEYLEHNEPDGCGVPIDRVEALIKDSPQVVTEWRKVKVGRRGGNGSNQHQKVANSSNPTVSATDRGRAYTLARLEREAPAMHAAVCAGEMTANAAAIQAGIRKPPRASLAKIKADIARLSDSQRRDLVAWLREEGHL